MAYEIKERSLGEILDGAFQLYRNHFGVFLGVALCVTLPSTLFSTSVSWLITGHMDVAAAMRAVQSETGADMNMAEAKSAMYVVARAMLAAGITFPVVMLGHIIQSAAMTLFVSATYLGQSLSVAAAFRRAFARLWPLLAASALAGLGVMLGFLFLIVPGILLMLRWMFTTPAIMIEGYDGKASLARSRDLAEGAYGRLFLLLVVIGLLSWSIQIGVAALVPDSVDAIPVLGQLLTMISQVLVSPLGAAAFTLAYFDLRVRKEGFDLERLALGLGQPAGDDLRP
jgi:hypothetical protein